jgi:hypothetical protein
MVLGLFCLVHTYCVLGLSVCLIPRWSFAWIFCFVLSDWAVWLLIVSYRMVLADGLDGGWMAGVRVGKRSHFFPIYLLTT